MAAEEGAERTEQPTPRRRQEARERGQVARSTDLTAAVALLGALLLLNAFGASMFQQMLTIVEEVGDTAETTTDGMVFWITRTSYLTVFVAAPFLLLVMTLGIVGGLTQTGGLFSAKQLKFKSEALNPVKGLQRLFSSEAAVRLGTGVLKIVLLAVVAWYTVRGRVGEVLGTTALDVLGMMQFSGELIFTLGLRLALVLLLIGLADYFFHRWKLEKSLKMTKQEVRDELKNMEGDPLIRQRRRQLQAKLALQRIQRDVPKATVVVTNPSEYAVALQYDEGEMPAPKVIAKGTDFLALRIRQIATQHHVPIVQRPPLARALYASVEIGEEIPPRFYRAVAEVLAYVYRLTQRAAG